MEYNFTDYINEAIQNTASLFHNDSIKTAKDMIPAMNPERTKNIRKLLNVSYGEQEDAKMDVYFPDDRDSTCAGPHPVFVEVHGGAWYFGQKSSIEFEPFLLGLEKGFICISLEYTMAPDGHYPLPVIQIRKAIAFIKAHASEWNLDPDRIALWGGSAGAHLTALATFSSQTGYLSDFVKSDDNFVHTLILWYGCFNYFIEKRLDEWIYANFFGNGYPTEKITERILSNPGAHVTPKVPYTILQHGLTDGLVPYQQSVYLYDVIKNIAGEDRVVLELVPECDHADQKLFARSNVEKMFERIMDNTNHST